MNECNVFQLALNGVRPPPPLEGPVPAAVPLWQSTTEACPFLCSCYRPSSYALGPTYGYDEVPSIYYHVGLVAKPR